MTASLACPPQWSGGTRPARASAGFLDRSRVAGTPGTDFGAQGTGFVRLNIGTSPDILREITGRLGAAVDPVE